jgi:hypothetical protein
MKALNRGATSCQRSHNSDNDHLCALMIGGSNVM